MLDTHSTQENGPNLSKSKCLRFHQGSHQFDYENKFITISQFCTVFPSVPHVYSSKSTAAKDIWSCLSCLFRKTEVCPFLCPWPLHPQSAPELKGARFCMPAAIQINRIRKEALQIKIPLGYKPLIPKSPAYCFTSYLVFMKNIEQRTFF